MTYTINTIAAPTVEPVTLAEAKLQCRVDTSADDALIAALISAARELAEAMVDRAYAEGTYELVCGGFDVNGVVLPRPPVTDVVSVKYLDASGVLQTMPTADYVARLAVLPPIVTLADGAQWPETAVVPDAVRVQFVAGLSPDLVPQRVKQWMMLHITTWYENRASINVGNIVTDIPGVRALLDPERWSWF